MNMISITLKRSGGMLGKTLQASGNFEIDETLVNQAIANINPASNPDLRDGFVYKLSINGSDFITIDPATIKGPLKKILSGLEDALKVI